MASYEWFLVDLINLIYNLTWLVFLTYKHYGQVTTTAGHIFELNVLLNVTITNFFLILIVDLELLPKGTISEIFDTASTYSFSVAIAGSQIETAIFLKTLDTNTMMTNTAGKIILAMDIFSLIAGTGTGVISTLAQPSSIQNKLECHLNTPKAFYQFTIPCTVVLVILLGVIGFAVFRSRQIRKTRPNEEHFSFEVERNVMEVINLSKFIFRCIFQHCQNHFNTSQNLHTLILLHKSHKTDYSP